MPRHVSTWTPAAYEVPSGSDEWVELYDAVMSKTYYWNRRTNSTVWKAPVTSSGTVHRMRGGSGTFGTGLLPVRMSSLLFLLADGLRGEGLGIPSHHHGCRFSCCFVEGDMEWDWLFLVAGRRAWCRRVLERLASSGCCPSNVVLANNVSCRGRGRLCNHGRLCKWTMWEISRSVSSTADTCSCQSTAPCTWLVLLVTMRFALSSLIRRQARHFGRRGCGRARRRPRQWHVHQVWVRFVVLVVLVRMSCRDRLPRRTVTVFGLPRGTLRVCSRPCLLTTVSQRSWQRTVQSLASSSFTPTYLCFQERMVQSPESTKCILGSTRPSCCNGR